MTAPNHFVQTVKKISLAAINLLVVGLFPAQSQVSELFKYPPKERLLRICTYVTLLKKTEGSEITKTIDSLRKLARSKKDDQLDWYIRLFGSSAFSGDRGYLPTKTDQLLRDLPVFNKSPYPDVKASCYFYLGVAYYKQQDYEKAFHYLINATDMFEQIGYENIPLVNQFAFALFEMYYRFEDYQSAIHFLKIGMQFSDSLQQWSHTFNLNNLGVTYLKMKDYTRAKKTFLQVMEEAKKKGKTDYVGIASGNYGNALRLQGYYAEALPYLYRDVELNEKEVPENSAISCLYIANCLLHLDSIDKAGYYINKGLQIFSDLTWGSMAPNYYETKALYYRKTKNFPRAVLYHDSLLRLKDSLRTRFNNSILLTTSLKLKEEKMLAKQREKQLEADNLRITRNHIIGMLLLIFTIIIIILRQRQRKAKEQLEAMLTRDAEKLQKAEDDLAQYLNIIKEKTRFIEEVEGKLAAQHVPLIDTEPGTLLQKESLSKLVLLTENDWKEFQQLVTRVWPQFFIGLHARFPALSPAEIRLIALSRLHLSSREMSNMLGISMESLRKARYRLRKKYPELLNDENDTPEKEKLN